MRKTTSNIKYQAVMSQSRQEFMAQNKIKNIYKAIISALLVAHKYLKNTLFGY